MSGSQAPDNNIHKEESPPLLLVDILEGTTDSILEAIPPLKISKANHQHAADLVHNNTRVVIIGGSIGGMATAACLAAAGFTDITVLEKAAEHRHGAGIGLDDASVAILKGLGIALGSSSSNNNNHQNIVDITVQKMRYTEERNGNARLLRQPYPYSAVLYSELGKGLEKAAATSTSKSANSVTIQRGCKALKVESENGISKVYVEGREQPLECDLVVAADGPRSRFRSHFYETPSDADDDLRFAGYTAWRGTIPEKDLPPSVVQQLRSEYPHFSNCLYFIWGPPGKSAVLYDIGNGLVNWLLYETCDNPKAPPGRTTTTATSYDVQELKQQAKAQWGPGLGGVIEYTPEPFQNDIYDIRNPLKTLQGINNQRLCAVGDCAHPITPHCAKGSNLAIHDAYILAQSAQHATAVEDMLQEYSRRRIQDTRTTVLLSRHLGRIRKGMPLMTPSGQPLSNNVLLHTERPQNAESFRSQVYRGGLATATIPLGGDCDKSFEPIWKFLEDHIPTEKRGFCLDRSPPPLQITDVNHISRETEHVDRLVQFYTKVLGLPMLPRPDFGFGGAWLALPGGKQLHIIECDPEKPAANTSTPAAVLPPERFIRRGHHMALTVPDIERAKATLTAHKISFAINKVPGTAIEQLFVYDPDGNGIEIGNFAIHN